MEFPRVDSGSIVSYRTNVAIMSLVELKMSKLGLTAYKFWFCRNLGLNVVKHFVFKSPYSPVIGEVLFWSIS